MRKAPILSLALLSACMVGPRYESPQMELAPEFTENSNTPGSVVDLRTWWTQFDDPILNEMVDEAIENNYDLRIAAERIEEVRSRYNLASANLWPEVDLNGSISRNKISENICGNGGRVCPPVNNLYLIGFDASWELDFFGRLRSLKDQAFFELEASQENMRNVYITLLAELTRTYADFRTLQQRIWLTSEQIRVNQELLNLSLVRFQAGLKAEIEPLETKATLDALQASLPPLEAQMHQSLYAIAVLLGRQPEQIPETWLAKQPIPQANGKIPIGLPSDLLRRRPDIRKAEKELAAASSNVRANIALLFPSFSLTGFFGYQSDQASQWLVPEKSQAWGIGPNVFWPVIDFGRIRAQIDFSKALQRESLLNYENTVIQALGEVEDALIGFSKEQKRLNKLRDQIEDLRQSRDLGAAKFEAGLDSFSNLLDAEQQLLFAEQTFISSEQTLSENLIAVYKSLGGEWPCSSTP